MLALKVPKARTQTILKDLLKQEMVDTRKKIVAEEHYVIIPLKLKPSKIYEGTNVIEVEDSNPRKSSKPIDRIRDMLALDKELQWILPYKWELIGDVLVFKLHPSLKQYRKEIAQAYASVLNAKTVFEDIEGIKDEFREPKLERIIGEESETIHRENGVLYKLDVSKLMFSSGNKYERMHMAEIEMNDEYVLDMFAGIGYFSLPIAKYNGPKKVASCEKNSIAYHYLLENMQLNRLDNIKPILKDCRDLVLNEKVDRIIMGYVKDTHRFLPKAFELINDKGIIHYHEVCPMDLLPHKPIKNIEDIALKQPKKVKIKNYRVVKSYAPKVQHIALDIHLL